MSNKMINLTAVLLVCSPFAVNAQAPVIQSASPVIYLADNLDEKDKLGWCIDTQGRGFSNKLHAHSCKPDKGKASDTQFSFDKNTGQLHSVAFSGKCAALNQAEDKTTPFGLIDCDASSPAQQFSYDKSSMEIHISSDATKCLVVGAASKSAGPFMSRDLIYKDCQSVESKYKQWVIKP